MVFRVKLILISIMLFLTVSQFVFTWNGQYVFAAQQAAGYPDTFSQDNVGNYAVDASGEYYNQVHRDRMLFVGIIAVIVLFGLIILLQIYIKYLKKKVSEEQEFLNRIINTARIIIMVMKPNGCLFRFNKYAQSLTGFTEEEVFDIKWLKAMIPVGLRPYMLTLFERYRNGEEPSLDEKPITLKDGTQVEVLWNNSVLYDTYGKLSAIIFMGVDITERKATERKLKESYAELEITHEQLAVVQEELKNQVLELQKSQEALRISEERYRLAVEGSNDGLWDLDMQSGKLFISARGKELIGFDENEEIDLVKWSGLLHPEDIPLYHKAMGDYLAGKNQFCQVEYRVKTKSGEYKWFLDRGKAIWDDEGRPVRMAGSQTDITERKKAEKEIHTLAYYDSLTGLPNRALLMDRLNMALAQARRSMQMAALLYLDLDGFKTINDTQGHMYGDELLKSVGDRMKKCVRECDTVARLGGDEFIILQPQIKNVNDVTAAASRILKLLQEPWVLNKHEFYITASIGITIFPGDGEDAQTLLKNADTAMYRAKELGRNNYQLYVQNMNMRMVEKLEMESSLRRAIERKEFVIHYQPQVDLANERIIGVEALVRWIHPEQGIVSPMKFIPLAEETGLIIPIGEWVLRTACEQNMVWQKSGLPPMCVAVNLSVRQFQQQNLVETIEKVLEETGMAPELLELEITESIAMQDIDYAVSILQRIKDMGIKVSLDDFGTGYSSLSYLKRLPINTLKIDKYFVYDITANSNEEAIAKAVIALAHNMRLTVTAEGVETERQLDFLKEQGCDKAQGYLFSKPLPAGEFESMMAEKLVLCK